MLWLIRITGTPVSRSRLMSLRTWLLSRTPRAARPLAGQLTDSELSKTFALSASARAASSMAARNGFIVVFRTSEMPIFSSAPAALPGVLSTLV